MKIIKLDAIDSTNSYVKRLLKDSIVNYPLIVVAKNQTNGRGQHDTTWTTEPYKNLTFSILINYQLDFFHQKYISFCASLAVIKFLEYKQFKNVKIKWPNDIMADDKKICGILIESLVRNGNIYASIIGIGLNVNQENFNSSLQKATSMKQLKNVDFDLDACLYSLLDNLFYYLKLFENKNFDVLDTLYHQSLYKKDEMVEFIDVKTNHKQLGIIRNVGVNGELIVENENGLLLQYHLKEIKFHF